LSVQVPHLVFIFIEKTLNGNLAGRIT